MAKVQVLLFVTLLFTASLAASITVNASANANASSSANVTKVIVINNASTASKIIAGSVANITAGTQSNMTTVNKTVTLTTAELIAQIIADAKAQAALILAQSHKNATKINPQPKKVHANVSHVHSRKFRMSVIMQKFTKT